MLLHGAGGGFRSFAPQVETLASLGFRAVAWNMPGYGLSPPIEPYGFKGLAESCIALIEALAPEGGAEPVALVGHGLGGMVAQEVALRRPDLVRQLVLVATAAAVAPGDAYSRHAAQGLGWLDEGRDMTAIAEALLPQLVSPRALPAGVQLARHVLTQVHAATWRRALQALSGFDRRAALGHIHVPTLLVAGAQDTVAPPAVLQGMAAAVSGARCVSWPMPATCRTWSGRTSSTSCCWSFCATPGRGCIEQATVGRRLTRLQDLPPPSFGYTYWEYTSPAPN
ncbi:alpha/beta fold hydrolase [Ottowia beijingensis]|uniref:alpha/beta fold hydrolase n=1 Tax=Ottowia beijingensis TaxID=1207057 RepID=UPI00280576DC|nr:alpha/beta hydrolase [Ottowia beijingensis]